jgi:ABC-2 type transport system permease protein
MKELMRLTFVSLKSVYGLSALLYDTKKSKKSPKRLVLFIVLVLCLLPAYILYISFTSLLYDAYVMLNQANAYLAQYLALTSVVILIFGISYILAYFYMAKDLDTLLSLPLRPGNIVLSKILTITISEYFFVLPIMLPPIIKYGVAQNCSFMYYFFSVIVIALLPVIVLSILAAIIMLLMKGASFKIKRDKIQLITLFLTLGFIIAFQFINARVTTSMGSNSSEAIAYFLQNSNALLSSITKIFFPAVIASKALVYYNSVNTLLYLSFYLLITAAVVFLCVILGKKVYLQSILASSNTGKTKQRGKNIDYKLNSPVIAIFKNDMRMILRTPIYMFNCLGTVFVIPIVILVMFYASGMKEQIDFAIVVSHKEMTILILAAIYTFFAGFSPVLSTTFSREGQSLWITKTIPTTTNEQLNGRLLTQIVLSIILLLASSITIYIVSKISLMVLLPAFLLALIASLPIAYISFLIDASRPLLNWDNPQRAVKQNFNVFFAMLFCIIYILIVALIAYIAVRLLANLKIVILLMFIILAICTLFIDKFTREKFKTLFMRIEI